MQTVAELTSLKSWEERIAKVTQLLEGVTPYPAEQLAAAASSFYYKLVAADKYKPSSQFKGEVVLVRAIDNYVQLGDDYGLNTVSFIFFCLFLCYFTNSIVGMQAKSKRTTIGR